MEDISIRFKETFFKAPERLFSAPGRIEIGGNHTDHQNGKVLAAAVSLSAFAAETDAQAFVLTVLRLQAPFRPYLS